MTTRVEDTEGSVEFFHLTGPRDEPTLSVWRQSAKRVHDRPAPAVVYVCGASFASEQAVGFRFDGESWADVLAACGFDVWAFDFTGYGRSQRYIEMADVPEARLPLGRATETARQVERVVRFVSQQRGGGQVHLIAHSWGTMPACVFAESHPELVRRLVLFGPIARREGFAPDTSMLGAWQWMSTAAQYQRFVADVPSGHAPLLSARHFEKWARAYLASDPEQATVDPPGVRIPCGPQVDIATAWAGQLPYDPAKIVSPVCILRGEWDSLCTDADARCLWDSFSSAPEKRDVKLSAGSHLMHLEQGRRHLYREALAFLADDVAGEWQSGAA
jgi:pimeloyl-ACP methyl ester carboxylesterase